MIDALHTMLIGPAHLEAHWRPQPAKTSAPKRHPLPPTSHSTSTVTNASRTMLMDLSTFQWHEPYLKLFNMPMSALPRIVSNSEVYGHVAQGPLQGVPVAGCLGDQMAALLGEGS